MLRKLIIFPIALTALLLIFGCQPPASTTSPTAPVTGIKVGNLAPDFTLEDLRGQIITLSSLRGHPVMLNFWATWCGWCVLEMPFIQQVYEEWQGKGLVILAIDKGESLATASEFIQSNNFSFTVLLDTNQAISKEYGVSGIPVSIFIDKDGIIQAVRLGAFLAKADMESYLDKIIP